LKSGEKRGGPFKKRETERGADAMGKYGKPETSMSNHESKNKGRFSGQKRKADGRHAEIGSL